jgi:hypothetical protein
MNNLQIPFVNLDAEMEALQKRSEDYQGKIAALKVVNRELNQEEIQKLSRLDNECQSAIAFCFSRRQPAI